MSICSQHCKLDNDIFQLEVVAGGQHGVVFSERPKAPGDELRRVMRDSNSGLDVDPLTNSNHPCCLLTPPGLSQGAWDTVPWLAAPFLRGQVQRLNPLASRGLLFFGQIFTRGYLLCVR